MAINRQIHNALVWLSSIGGVRSHYDPAGQVVGFAEIHYLVEVAGMHFMAWEDTVTRMIVVNPITRFTLDELDELGAACGGLDAFACAARADGGHPVQGN